MRNQRLFRIGIIIVVIAITGSFLVAANIRLKEPVFLRYCTEHAEVPEYVRSGSWFMELQYITNVDDGRKVNEVAFPEAGQIRFYASEYPSGGTMTFFSGNQPMTNGETIGRFSLRRLYIYMAEDQLELFSDGLELHQIQIGMSDGSSYLCDIGKIVLSGSDKRDGEISQSSSSSSSDGSFSSWYTIRGDFNFLELQTPLRQELDASVELLLNGEKYADYLPAEFKRGDSLEVEGRFRMPFGKSFAYDVYDIKPKLTYIRPNGSEGYLRIYNITRSRYFNGAWDMFQYLSRVRGVL